MAPRIVIPESNIRSTSAGPMTIDRIEISKVRIPKVLLAIFKGTFTYASAKAKNVEFEMKLSIHSTFDGSVDPGWWSPSVDVSGGIDFDTYTEKHALGDIVMDGGSFSMDSTRVNFGPFVMEPDPIGSEKDKTAIGGTKVETIEMKCTEIPLNNPLGVELGSSLPISNPMGPVDVHIQETSIAKLESIRIVSPPATMRNIQAQNIKIPFVTTKPFEIHSHTGMTVNTSKQMYGSGVTRYGDADMSEITGYVTLNVQEVILRIRGGVELKDLAGTVTTASASSDPFIINLELTGLKIKGLNIYGMNIPEIELDI